MHTKSLSVASTKASYVIPSKQAFNSLQIQNKMLKQELAQSKQQSIKMKQQVLKLYQQNLRLRDKLNTTEQNVFIKECQDQIERLRGLLDKIMDTKYSGGTQREQIKDRIIMKLEDELISLKIQLKEQKLKNIKKQAFVVQQQ